MNPSKRSCVLILMASGLLVSAGDLLATQDEIKILNRNNAAQNFTSPSAPNPAAHHRKTAHQQHGTKENPLYVEVVGRTIPDTESAKQKEHDEKLSLDRQTLALNQETVQLNSEMTKFTGYLAGLGFLQLCVLIAQICILFRQTGFNAAQVENQRVIERAYAKMSHRPPGLHFLGENEETESGGVHTYFWWIALIVGNYGRTPARITNAIICRRYFHEDGEPPPISPDYSHEPQERLEGGFLLTNDEVNFTFQGRFENLEEARLVKEGRGRFFIYGYVDYIDQFGKHHRAGYGREFSAQLNDRDNYASEEDFKRRSNLSFVPEPGYNYDREHRNGEGRDWSPRLT